MVKPIVSSVMVSFSIPATFANAKKPNRSETFNISSPKITNARFSSVNETRSAIVPIATRSTSSVGNSPNNAVASLKATPTPANSPKGYAPCGCFG